MKPRRLRRLFRLQTSRFWRLLRRNRGALTGTVVTLVLLTLASRVCVSSFLATDEPGDGVVYARLATNLVEQGVFSSDVEAPFSPTFIRMPGYPIFIAGVYSVFGEGNNTAVRVVQAVLDTGTCVLAAMIAFAWTDGKRRRRAAFWTYVLASACPFIVIYTATILSETLTTFLMAALTLTATLALKSPRQIRSALWWILAGLLAGCAVFVRPDAGLFAAGIGLTLVIGGLFFLEGQKRSFARRFGNLAWKGAAFSLVFLITLMPWTVRNWRTFGVFQPLSPAHGEMPGEFVSFRYNRWLRTWVDDSRYVEPTLWNLNEKRIDIDVMPPHAFDSPEEKQQVAILLNLYNYPPGTQKPKPSDDQSDSGDDNSGSGDASSDNQADDRASSPEEQDQEKDQPDEQSDQGDQGDNSDEDEDAPQVVKMTPPIDAAFGAIADARIEWSPARYYFWTPLKRAGALWFDSHSLYWPFGGQISKVADLDYDEHQQYWLPFLLLMTWIYTALLVLGAIAMWRDRSMLRWLIMLALMTLPRLIFFSTVENPEPRYVVELFLFAAIAGGIWLASRKHRLVPRPELSPSRLVSLDVFRGITIAAMTLVNNPGTWSAIYPPLEHAAWNGTTPTDYIFPFFLFIMGVSVAFAFGKYQDRKAEAAVYAKIGRRTMLLFGLGLFLNILPIYNLWTGLWFDPSHTRVLGVLQRIAICYAAASLVFLWTRWRTQVGILAALLLGYWGLVALIAPPDCTPANAVDMACNLGGYIDRAVFGLDHMWNQSKGVDPEGLLSTLPAIGTALLGLLAGQWLRSSPQQKKVPWMLAGGAALVAVGWLWGFAFPLNKNLWTSSYVLYTGGLAGLFLAAIYWLVDLKGYKKWAMPFVIFGTNAIVLYVGSDLLAVALDVIQVTGRDGRPEALQERIFNTWFLPYSEPVNASLMFAVAFVLLCLFGIWVMYKRRIFLKV